MFFALEIWCPCFLENLCSRQKNALLLMIWRFVCAFIFFFATEFLDPNIHLLNLQASKRIADAKLAKDFQAVLKEFQKAQRLAVERETAYTPFVPKEVLPSR